MKDDDATDHYGSCRTEHRLYCAPGPRHLRELSALRNDNNEPAERGANDAEHGEHLAGRRLLQHRLLKDVGGGVEARGDHGEEVAEERSGRS